ncbi:MAG TPA: response regulator [Steroidobacteraceae bacterium]|jgi:two-component system cell cycle response regulator CpdR|nr:response regulator [Steroidobacteraceae bacterium]
MTLRILYVEDNELVREVTSELLAQDEREVVARATAEEALAAFRENAFDVVITDVSLPLMSGLDLARNLLALRPNVPIILASGYALNSVVQNLGPNVRTIVKPFEAGEIDLLITDLCVA